SRVRRILEGVRSGRLSLGEAETRLATAPFDDLGFAKVDSHRAIRCGFPEVIYCAGKSPGEVEAIAAAVLAGGDRLLAPRATRSHAEVLLKRFPDAVFHERASIVTIRRDKKPRRIGLVFVLSAGTSDVPVAEEARLTAEMMNARVETLYDVGVAGVH